MTGLVSGWMQNRAANRLKESKYIPSGVRESVTNARMGAMADSPMYTRGKEQLAQSTARTINTAKRIGGTGAQVQQAAADADAREKQMIKDLEVSNNAFKAGQRNELNRALSVESSYKQRNRDAFNAAKSALKGAAIQNVFGAINNAASGLIMSASDERILGQGGDTSSGVSGSSMMRNFGMNPTNLSYSNRLSTMKRPKAIPQGNTSNYSVRQLFNY